MRVIQLSSIGFLATQALSAPTYGATAKKNGVKIPVRHWRHSSPLEARDGNTTAANDGGGWLLTAQVGPSSLTLNIDTGSSDLWVASTLLPSDEQAYVQTGHALYDPGQSTTAQSIDGESFNIQYADGSGSSGPEYTESVTIGGANLPSMAIGVCNSLKLGSGASSRNSDGPVGLGFQSINSASPNKEPTFAEALVGAGAVSQPVFTTHFTTDESGFILFGSTDSSLYTGSLSQLPVDNSTGFWLLSDLTFGTNSQPFSDASPLTCIADTGGPGLDIPASSLSAYYSSVPGASQDSGGTWSYPCGTDLPDLDVFFPQVLNGGPSSISLPGNKLKNGDGAEGDRCYTRLGAAGDGGQGSLGVPFFGSLYIEWDLSGPTMSVARQA